MCSTQVLASEHIRIPIHPGMNALRADLQTQLLLLRLEDLVRKLALPEADHAALQSEREELLKRLWERGFKIT